MDLLYCQIVLALLKCVCQAINDLFLSLGKSSAFGLVSLVCGECVCDIVTLTIQSFLDCEIHEAQRDQPMAIVLWSGTLGCERDSVNSLVE
jgi:hypothetical protein